MIRAFKTKHSMIMAVHQSACIMSISKGRKMQNLMHFLEQTTELIPRLGETLETNSMPPDECSIHDIQYKYIK